MSHARLMLTYVGNVPAHVSDAQTSHRRCRSVPRLTFLSQMGTMSNSSNDNSVRGHSQGKQVCSVRLNLQINPMAHKTMRKRNRRRPRKMMILALLLLSVLLCLSLPLLLLSHVVFAAYEHNGTTDYSMIAAIVPPLPAMWNQTIPSSAGTIYVGLTVTDEESCESTLTSLILNASRPELLRVAVVVVNKGHQGASSICAETGQALLGDEDSQNKIEVIHLNSNLYPPILASTIISRYYKGEHFALTVAETNGLSFTRRWDEDLMDQHARTRNDRAVLTTYLTRKEVE